MFPKIVSLHPPLQNPGEQGGAMNPRLSGSFTLLYPSTTRFSPSENFILSSFDNRGNSSTPSE